MSEPAAASKHHERNGAGHVEWLTPREILSKLGTFDLDPAATCSMSHDALPWATARRMICKCRDGLAARWEGRVWLNPPYDRTVEPWLRKLAGYGHGIALVFGRFETAWFRRWVWGFSSGILFVHQRIRFCRPDGRPAERKAGGAGSSGTGSVLVAYGQENVRALERSGIEGDLVREWDPIPRGTEVQLSAKFTTS